MEAGNLLGISRQFFHFQYQMDAEAFPCCCGFSNIRTAAGKSLCIYNDGVDIHRSQLGEWGAQTGKY